MSPVLATLVANASSIQQQNVDPTRRILAWLISGYGAGALGQANVLASQNTRVVATAQSVAAKFQGLTDEQFLDILTYSLAVTLNTNGVSGIVAAGAVPTNGTALINLVDGSWGIPNGVVDAAVVKALIQYGMLLQVGANLTNL